MEVTAFLNETNNGLTNMPGVSVKFSKTWISTSGSGFGDTYTFLQGKTRDNYYRVDTQFDQAIAMEFTPSISLKSIPLIIESSSWISQVRVVDDDGNEKVVVYPGRSGNVTIDINWKVKKLYWEPNPEAGMKGGYAPYAKQFLGFVLNAGITQKFLVQSENTIKKLSGSWSDIGVAPVTDQMFKDHGMASLNDITAEQWKALPKNSKILAYTEENKTFNASISRSMLYNAGDKLYHGTGIIETVAEELPVYRRTLMIAAEHQECTFECSLDNGATWTAFQPNDVIDVSKKSGKQLKIRTTLPTDTATLTAISYAWA